MKSYWWVVLIVLPPITLGLWHWSRLGKWMRIIISLTLIGATGVFIGRAIVLKNRVADPPMWDFLSFWTYSRVALTGHDFYLPASYASLQLPLAVSDEFKEDILGVGFKYPPPTMFLFLWLGVFSFSNAYLLWMSVNILALLLTLFIFWKILFLESGWQGALIVVLMVVCNRSLIGTFAVAQSNILLLLLIALLWKDYPAKLSFLWLALAIIVKPVAAACLLLPIAQREWKLIILSFAVLLGSMVVYGIAFGFETVVHFFTDSPASRTPAWIYSEPVNQSLLATILRRSDPGQPGPVNVHNPSYLTIAVVMILITLIALHWRRDVSKGLALGICISLGLVVYPGTLEHYSLLLLVPVFGLIDDLGTGGSNLLLWACLTSIIYALLLFGGAAVFAANLSMWLITSIVAWGRLSQKPLLTS